MSDIIESPAKAKAKALKQYKITFHGKGGDVEIGHNFKLNVYKRNVETTIDENFLDVLKHTVISTIVQDENGKKETVSIPTYQYTVESL
ncbi:MAG: hypothetical protein JWR74_3193 [Polaromonas sp.]|nr:hypothetical protein [Polaromonas sp.]